MAESTTRSMIAAMQVSLDGFAEGPEGELLEVESWADGLGMLPEIDTFLLGGGMYGAYEGFWSTLLTDPDAAEEMLGRPPLEREVAYARLAAKTPHVVLSTTMTATWPNTRVVPDLAALRELKQEPGLDIYVVGGPGLVASLINEGLLDELRLIVHPVLMSGGKSLFGGVDGRRTLRLDAVERLDSARVALTYHVENVESPG
jgi:dihydrofolate reductase